MTGRGRMSLPPQPDANEAITLRFRTAKDDVDAVRLLTRDAKYDLQKVYTKGEFDFYEVNWRMGEDTFRYCFEIQKGRGDLLLQQIRCHKRDNRILRICHRSGVCNAGLGKRRSNVSDFCGSFLIMEIQIMM